MGLVAPRCLQAMEGGLKAGDAARREAARGSDAVGASRRDAISGLEAFHSDGQRRGEQRRNDVG